MEVRKITLSYEEYASRDELKPLDLELLDRAIEASKAAYSPYSTLNVGAAVRLANGLIVTGNNQENAAYPSGLCAERVALFHAQSQFPETAITALAVYASAEGFTLQNPITPCGACRQVMAEYEYRHNQKYRIIMGNGNGKVWVAEGIAALLPLGFYLEELKKH